MSPMPSNYPIPIIDSSSNAYSSCSCLVSHLLVSNLIDGFSILVSSSSALKRRLVNCSKLGIVSEGDADEVYLFYEKFLE